MPSEYPVGVEGAPEA